VKMVLTLFSELNCDGASVAIKDKEVNLAKAGVKFQVKSAIVEGNPWILYSTERFGEFLCFLEDGRHEDLKNHGIPDNYKVASAKLKTESAANPHIILFNSSKFKDDTEALLNGTSNGQPNGSANGHSSGTRNGHQNGSANGHSNGATNGHSNGTNNSKWQSNGDQKISCVSADKVGGVWIVTQDMSVMYKEGSGYDSKGKEGWKGWIGGLGKMRSVSVGPQCVWGVNRADEVFIRIGLSPDDPRGKEWTKIEGSMKTISVGPTGVCWAVDKNDTVWRRTGAKGTNVLGTKWQSVTGRLKHISVGQMGVWGISPKNEVMFRDGTHDLPGEAEGTGWTKVDGMMKMISSCDTLVWGVSEDGGLWYRSGVNQGTPMGTNWFRIQDGLDIGWRMVTMMDSVLWGVDSRDGLMARSNVNIDNIQDGNAVHIFHQCQNFKLYNLQEKPSSYVVLNGGWAIHEKPGFKGRLLYHADGDCYSNDPVNPKGLKLKNWQSSIGSIRPIIGDEESSISVKIELDWNSMQKSVTTTVLEVQESKNSTFSYAPAPWGKVQAVEASVRHSFEFDQPEENLTGSSFVLEEVPKTQIEIIHEQGKLEFGKEFRQEMMNKFTFSTDSQATRDRVVTEVMSLPSSVPPMFELQLSTVRFTGEVTIPFRATFESGIKTWHKTGLYTGTDSTNVKLLFKEKSLLESNRKFSKI